MLINSKIPNTMSHKGLEFLARIAAAANENSNIVEAGSLYGCTAWVLSQNSSDNVSVTAIDPWEHTGFLNRFKINNHRVPDLSEHAFRAYTYDCENLKPVKGYAPDAAKGLGLNNVDIVFEDAAHSYDILKQNVEYFYPLLNEGGIFCGDDYNSAFPGVIKCVDELAEKLGAKPHVCGQVWAIQKPFSDSGSADLHKKIGSINKSEIGIKLVTDAGEELSSIPHCMTPNLFKPEKLDQISLYFIEDESKGLDFKWQLKFSDDSESAELSAGDTVKLKGKAVKGIRVRLSGKESEGYNVGYQIACAKTLTDDLKKLGPSREKFNGSWLETDDPDQWMYALSVSIVSDEIRAMRNSHAQHIKVGKEVGETLYGDAGKKIRK